MYVRVVNHESGERVRGRVVKQTLGIALLLGGFFVFWWSAVAVESELGKDIVGGTAGLTSCIGIKIAASSQAQTSS